MGYKYCFKPHGLLQTIDYFSLSFFFFQWNSVRPVSRCRSRSLSPICPRSRIGLGMVPYLSHCFYTKSSYVFFHPQLPIKEVMVSLEVEREPAEVSLD